MSNPRDARIRIIGDDDTAGATRSAGRNLGELERHARRTGDAGRTMGDRFRAGVKSMVPVALAAGVALAKLGADAVKNASASEQSMGATQQVFGKYADKVISTSKTAAKTFGVSANGYRESANLIGSSLKNQGVAADQIAGKTKTLIGLGADLSAVFGGTATDAIDALSSAFKGEFDPIERYGISLKQSTINSEAFRVAGVKTQKEFDKLSDKQQALAKNTATTNLITQQSTSSLGQFAAQSGTTAEQTQILKARYEDLSAQLGAKLLPIINRVLEVGTNIITWLSQHQEFTIAAATAVGILTGGIILLNLAMLANPIGLVIVALALLAGAFVALWRNSQTFRTIVTAAFKVTANVILGSVSALLGGFADLMKALGHIPGAAGAGFRAAARSAEAAKAKVDGLRDSINGVKSKSVTLTVGTIFYQKGRAPGSYGKGLGVLLSAGGTFAAADAGVSRTGGPQRIDVTAGDTMIETAVYLDGELIRGVARSEITKRSDADAHRARTGRRL